jgi:ABC-2 type transport system ATP-binding protein
VILVEGARKRFGRVVALDGVSLRIGRGERVAIVGTNGSGKTTLLRAILGLVSIEGKVTIGGVDVARDPRKALARVAYAPQIAPAIDASVEDIVRLQCALRGHGEGAVTTRAARLGLDLRKVSSTRFRDLSGGTKQKVLASLALAAEAEVLVCDEPTANLDPQARAAFFAQVDERAEDAIVVLCSHRVDEVRHLVRRVIELRDGRVAHDAPLHAVLRGLVSSRVEVRVSDHPATCEFLTERGFEPNGMGRWAGRFTHQEKLEVVAELLGDHRDAVLDLSVFDDGEVSSASPASASPASASPASATTRAARVREVA